MIRGEYILGMGVLLDMITTIYGHSIGLLEKNVLDFYWVLIINIIPLYLFLFTIKYERHIILDYIMYFLGGYKVVIFILNIFIIVTFINK